MVKKSDILKEKVKAIDFDKIKTVEDLIEAYKDSSVQSRAIATCAIALENLDRMAREGTRYTQAYCGTSVCAPSRASLITGLHSGHCPVRGNWEIAKGAGQ